MSKTIFFDLGGVLLYFSHKRMCEQIASALDVPVQMIYDQLFKSSLGRKIELGEINSNDLYRILMRLSSKKVSYFDLLIAASDIFEPNQEILPLLAFLKKKGCRLILLSNTCEAHYNYAYSHFPHLQYFDEKILSYEVGMRKPNLKIFQKALIKAQASLKNSFYTDDLKENVRAAEKLGITSHIFQKVDSLQLELERFV